METSVLKPAVFLGSCREDLRDMPDPVRRTFGQAIFAAQAGGMAFSVKPLKGFHGARVLEVVEDFDTDTYRAVYTVRFPGAVYVLHCFQKKSKRQDSMTAQDRSLIEHRLRQAEQHYRKHFGGGGAGQ